MGFPAAVNLTGQYRGGLPQQRGQRKSCQRQQHCTGQRSALDEPGALFPGGYDPAAITTFRLWRYAGTAAVKEAVDGRDGDQEGPDDQHQQPSSTREIVHGSAAVVSMIERASSGFAGPMAAYWLGFLFH